MFSKKINNSCKYFTNSNLCLRLGLFAAIVIFPITYSLTYSLPFFDWPFLAGYAITLLATGFYWLEVARKPYQPSLSWTSLLLTGGILLVLVIHALAGIPLPTGQLLLRWSVALTVLEMAYHWGHTRLGVKSLLQVSQDLLFFVSIWTLVYFIMYFICKINFLSIPFDNTGVLGNYLIGLWPYALAVLNSKPIVKNSQFSEHRLMQIVIVMVSTVAIALTLARAAWLGAGAAALVVFYLKQPLRWRLQHKKILIGWLFLGLGSGTFLLAAIMKPVSAYGRLHIFAIATQMATQGLPWGLGLGQASIQFNEFQARYFATGYYSWKQKLVAYNTYEVFNSILHVLIEAGVLGLLFYGLLLVFIAWAAYQLYHTAQPPASQIGALGAIVGLLISSGLSNPFHHLPVLFIACWSLSLLPLPALRLPQRSRIIGRSLFGVGLISSVWLVGKDVYGACLWQKAANQVLMKKESTIAFINYEKAYPLLSSNGAFLYNYGSELSVAKKGKKAIEVLLQTRQYYTSAELYTYLGQAYEQVGKPNAAALAFQHASWIIPAQLYPRYRLFMLYRQTGRNKAAWQVGQQLLMMPVKVPSLATQDIRSKVQQELALCREPTCVAE